MDLGIYPDLTKDFILQRVTQEQIMEYYLNVSVVLDTLIITPPVIRTNDTNPTFSFYYNQHGRLRGRDFGPSEFWGDCFDVVARVIGVDASSKRGFQMVIHTIAKDFRLHKYEHVEEVTKYELITHDFFKKKKVKHKTRFKITPRQYNYHDYGFWKRFNINQTLLHHGKVYCAEDIYISKDGEDYTLIYRYSTKDPAYCYYGGKDENGIEEWKIYYPYRKAKGESGFHSNSSFLQGKHLITCGQVGVITKGYKDVLSMRSFGFQAVAESAESVMLSKDNYWFMRTKFDYLVSCMDYGTTGKIDRTGRRMAWKLRDVYGIPPIMFTNGQFKTVDYGSKDFSDYVDDNGVSNTNRLLQGILNKHQDIHKLQKYYYNSLKFIR